MKCFVTDLGPGGFRVLLLQPVRAGAAIPVVLDERIPHLGGLRLTGVVRHQQQVEPADPFGYGCAFQGLTPVQEEALKSFMIEQYELNWERTEEWPEVNFFAAPAETVEIPSLSSILDESEDETEDG